MRIGMIGTGYVGLVAAGCFAHMGNEVICTDINAGKIGDLNRGVIPIYEPGLEAIVTKCRADGRLKFTTDLAETVHNSLFVFIAVGTPPDENGAADLKFVLKAAGDIGSCMESYKIIIIKSTVPVGTADRVRETVSGRLRERGLAIEFDLVSNPEFMKEGDAVNDFMKPDRVIIGTDNVRTAELIKEIYSPFAMDREKIIIMDNRSAELTKYAANAMLAARISFMNEMANICELVGADINKVRQGIGSDRRIGYSFIYPGIGFGGSCFPKDVRALISTAEEFNCEARILKAVNDINEGRCRQMLERIMKYHKGELAGKTAAIWGLSFKPNTNDVRESPALNMIKRLLEQGSRIHAYDPEAISEAKRVLGENGHVRYFANAYDALAGADFLMLATEWHLFRNPDFDRVKKLLKSPVIFDGRNQYDPAEMRGRGFEYFCVGRV